MTLTDFSKLSTNAQSDYLHSEGIYIGKLRYALYTITLYQIDAFYVEVRYRQYRRSISSIHCFLSTARLIPYLNEIDISIALKCVERISN